MQSIFIRKLELSGLILDKNVDHMPKNDRQDELNSCLEKLSQHMHDNAFDSIWFGVNSHGFLGGLSN